MRRSIFLWIAWFTATLTVAGMNQPVVRIIRFTGVRGFGEDELAGRMTLRVGSRFSSDQLRLDCEKVLTFYQEAGYYFAQVAAESLAYSKDSSNIDVVIGISEGERAVVDSIEFHGSTLFAAQDLENWFAVPYGSIFEKSIIEGGIVELISRYGRSGYPFVKISVDSIDVVPASPPKVRVSMTIDEGKKIIINEIRVAGNNHTNPDVIIRETRIHPPELYNEEKVAGIQARLQRMNIFASVREPEVYLDSTGGGLLITVSEANTNTFDGILGYAPASTPTGSGAVAGYAHVTLGNLFGTTRRLDVMWQHDAESSQEINLSYSEPWVFNFPINLSGAFRQRQQDSTYVQRSVEGHIDFLASESFLLGGFISHTVVIPSSTLVFQPVHANRIVSVGVNLQLDTRDDIINPHRGIRYSTTYSVGSELIYGTSSASGSTSVQSATIDAEGYKGTLGNQVVALGLHARQITGSRVQVTDLFRFGGATTLRGYRENELTGSRIAWANSEYRFLLDRHSYFFGLFDAGFSYLPADIGGTSSVTKTFDYGYGIGFRVDTPLGNIGVILALGKGDTFSEGKLHFSLLNRF